MATKKSTKTIQTSEKPAETDKPSNTPAVKPKSVKKKATKKPAKKSVKVDAKTPLKSTKSTSAKKTKSVAKVNNSETAVVLDSKVAYQGKLFRVMNDHIIEPGGQESVKDVIRHNGSVVILAIDPGKKKKDPWVVIERQYRHAAGQFLWELPAGKLDAGEVGLEGAKRELAEETGYQAKKWTPLVEYFASPGFLGESMKVFLAEGLIAGEAHPEADEHIDFRLVKLSEILEMIDDGKIIDGKTLTSVLLYARQLGLKQRR